MKYEHPYFRPHVQSLYTDALSTQVLISPIEKGFANPFANLLRKVLLKYTPGTGIVGISFDEHTNVHPYFKIPGCTEDVSHILNHLKSLFFQVSPYSPVVFKLEKKGPSIVRAKDLVYQSNVTILTPDLHICTIFDTSQLSFTLYGDIGYGFVPSQYFGNKKNVLYCDTVFSPIKHVSYYTRSYSTYEELVIYIKTNGVCDSLSALKNAFSFLSNKINIQTWI